MTLLAHRFLFASSEYLLSVLIVLLWLFRMISQPILCYARSDSILEYLFSLRSWFNQSSFFVIKILLEKNYKINKKTRKFSSFL
jgi:hypothetical protein